MCRALRKQLSCVRTISALPERTALCRSGSLPADTRRALGGAPSASATGSTCPPNRSPQATHAAIGAARSGTHEPLTTGSQRSQHCATAACRGSAVQASCSKQSLARWLSSVLSASHQARDSRPAACSGVGGDAACFAGHQRDILGAVVALGLGTALQESCDGVAHLQHIVQVQQQPLQLTCSITCITRLLLPFRPAGREAETCPALRL